MQLQGMDNIKETAVKDTHFFINMDLGHLFLNTACSLLGTDSCKF